MRGCRWLASRQESRAATGCLGALDALLPTSHTHPPNTHPPPAGLAVATVDRWGRRPLLLYGVSGIVLSLLALGTVQVRRRVRAGARAGA